MRTIILIGAFLLLTAPMLWKVVSATQPGFVVGDIAVPDEGRQYAPVGPHIEDQNYFFVIKMPVCDASALSKATGRSIDYIRIPWNMLRTAVVVHDADRPFCSLFIVSGNTYNLFGTPDELMHELERYKVKVISIDVGADD